MGHHQVDVVDGEAGLGDRLLGGLDDHPNRLAEDLLAVHVEIAAVVALEEVAQRSVRTQVPREQLTGTVHRLQHDGAGSVTDQHRDRCARPSR